MGGNRIGTLQESGLHAALKRWYAQPGDELEVPVDGYVIDLKRGAQLVEFQTGSFSNIKRKLSQLVAHHPVHLVYPVAQDKWIVRFKREAAAPSERRKSPKHGRLESVFTELVSFPELMAHPNFSLEVVLTLEEELQRPAKKRSGRRALWRRKGWQIFDRRLLEVVQSAVFTSPADFKVFLPTQLPRAFTTRDLAHVAGLPIYLMHKMTYCLRKMGVIESVGKRGRAVVYQIV
jgi:hypothetical protein